MRNSQAVLAILGLIGAAGFSVGFASGPAPESSVAPSAGAPVLASEMRSDDTRIDRTQWDGEYWNATRTPRYAVFFDSAVLEKSTADLHASTELAEIVTTETLSLIAEEAQKAPRVEITPVIWEMESDHVLAHSIAVQRAEWVRRALIGLGVDPTVMVVTGAIPDRGPVESDTTLPTHISHGDPASPERVEVTIFKLSKITPEPALADAR